MYFHNILLFWFSSTFSDINSDDDRNVPFSETVTIAEALRKNDVYMEQLIFPDEVHSFLLYQNWLSAYKATANFFDKFLKKK